MAINVLSGYSDAVFTNIDRVIEVAKSCLAGVDYDTLIGTGLSGGALVPVLGRELGKHWAIVRKESATSHASGLSRTIQGTIGDRWVFADDFISTGATFQRVIAAMSTVELQEELRLTFAGAFLYEHTPCFVRPEDLSGYWEG